MSLPDNVDTDRIAEQRQQYIELYNEWWDALTSRTDENQDVDIEDIRERMVGVLEDIIDQELNPESTYKIQILQLLEITEGVINSRILSEAVGCSLSHAEQFKWDEKAGEAKKRDWAQREAQNRASHGKTRTIKRRDDCQCVKCGKSNNLNVHHIVPVGSGGDDCNDNLATLCRDCHSEAHGGTISSSYVIYNNTDEFWQWVNGDRHY